MPVRLLVFLCAAGLLAAGAAPALAAGPERKHLAPAVGCAPGSIRSLQTPRLSYAVQARRPLAAWRSVGGRVLQRFGTTNENGAATVFGVISARLDRSCRATWYRVHLPIRPNGSSGWVRAADVRLFGVRTRIAVDLSQRRVTLYRDGRPVLVTTAVIGSPATPTPTGRFYVNQLLHVADPTGTYGPGAVGISAFSPVLRNWPQGGPIAIHGTNAPDMIGFAVSHGCLRVRNVDISRLLRLTEDGTPVEIRR